MCIAALDLFAEVRTPLFAEVQTPRPTSIINMRGNVILIYDINVTLCKKKLSLGKKEFG